APIARSYHRLPSSQPPYGRGHSPVTRDSPPPKESSMRMRMPMSVLTAAGLSLTALGLGTAPATAAPAPLDHGASAPIAAYDGSSGEAAANRAFFEAVLKSAAEKRAANPSSAAAVTVVYNASRAPSFASQISRSAQIWN